jgi:2-C-methyl-D-erythritol 4-phosphate cytidylyltransferase
VNPPPVGTWAIVVAGGTGSRFGRPKQYEELRGRPVLAWSLAAARAACDRVVVVLPAGDSRGAEGDRGTESWDADVVVTGGATRSASVRAGLGVVGSDASVVVVHDAARPLAPLALWQAVIGAVRAGADAAVPTVAVTDTIKQICPDGSLRTLDRAALVAVQTPQAFRPEALRIAHQTGGDATDDAALIEAVGGRVVTVPGTAINLKITELSDLIVAAALLAGDPSGPEPLPCEGDPF